MEMNSYAKYSMINLASPEQVGEAAMIRSYVDDPKIRYELNQIVHHADKNPHKYGDNSYAEKKGYYDEAAEEVI